jgi:hypothetical protein
MTPAPARIRVEVSPAALAFERAAMFTAEGRLHAIVVDAQDLDGDLLRVDVVREVGDDLVIELPRPTLSGRFLRMPRDQVFAEPLGLDACAWLGLVLMAVVAVAAGAFLVVHALV